MSTEQTPERIRENLEVALVTLVTVCKRWPDTPLVVSRAIDVAEHVLRTGKPPAMSMTMISSRYMDIDSKLIELASWRRAKDERESAPPHGFVGGHGYPDPDIYTWVDKLNGLSRVCTLQSCAGHVCTLDSMCGYCESLVGGPPHETHVMNAQLWLWLDARLAVWFYQHVPRLAALTCIEKVSVLWHVEGREIVDIVFKGAGTGDLDTSMRAIVKFFEDGNATCNLG